MHQLHNYSNQRQLGVSSYLPLPYLNPRHYLQRPLSHISRGLTTLISRSLSRRLYDFPAKYGPLSYTAPFFVGDDLNVH